MARWTVWRLAACAAAFATNAVANQVLHTDGFTNCESKSPIRVNHVDITFDNDAKTIVFDIAGVSEKQQNVTATLSITAYGKDIYTNHFNPCEGENYIEKLCPAPAGAFAARGQQNIPPEYANSIPAIAFQVPDIAAIAKLQLKELDGGNDVGCIQSQVTNGKTANVPAVSYIAAGLAAGALVFGGVGAAGAAAGPAHAGSGVSSPSFTEVVGVFQGFAMNGMMSVSHPQVYRSFAKNFAFSTGIVQWTNMQLSIDNFRANTGGDLSTDGVQFLKDHTLVFPDGSMVNTSSQAAKRALNGAASLVSRDEPSPTDGSFQASVSGIKGYVEELSVPSANTFMTVLLIAAIVVAAIIVFMLLGKVILEAWALFGTFPKGLAGFREHYWGSIARTITSLILVLYSIWVLYCVYQFAEGDSWAAQLLAGVTLAIFTGVLGFFAWKIYDAAKKLKQTEGDVDGLYHDKSIWMKYSLFYDGYKKQYWWLFVPLIVYMLIKGIIMASLDGNGAPQAVIMLVVESAMLGLLIWSRPYERKTGNILNIAIQSVRLLSVACVLVFVEQFGVGDAAKTVTGVVLIAVQSALTGILAILIIWNGVTVWCTMNPHRKRRKELEKMQRDMDTLTPLDARNSLLMERQKQENSTTFSMASAVSDQKRSFSRSSSPANAPEPANPYSSLSLNDNTPHRPLTPVGYGDDRKNLVNNAAPIDQEYGYGQAYGGSGKGGYRGY